MRIPRNAGRVVTTLTAASLLVSGLAAASAATTGPAAAAPPDPGPTSSSTAAAEKITDEVAEELAEAPTDFWVRFDDAPDLSKAQDIADWTERGEYVVRTLQEHAEREQADVVAALDEAGKRYSTYWVSDAILVEDGTPSLAREIALAAEVSEIHEVETYDVPEPAEQGEDPTPRPGDEAPPTAAEGAAAQGPGVAWGVAEIGAPELWARGITGDGITVAGLDTGVDYSHPTLLPHYRGLQPDGTLVDDYNWFDAVGQCWGGACDGHGHGTHTMGTVVGDDGQGNQIGVAPGARWIATNAMVNATDNAVLASGQWLLAPTKADGTAPDPSKRPHVINNSWGFDTRIPEPFFNDVVAAWDAAGIFNVWSAGNSGPTCDTIGSPGTYDGVLAVGAHAQDGTIAKFSSRGPGADDTVKPDVTAPGVLVHSALPGGAYADWGGTSMAAPHVTGAVALLWDAVPSLVGDTARTRTLIESTAHPKDDTSCGGTAEDNGVWGNGTLDAVALVDAALADPELVQGEGTVTGTVTDEAGAPVADAQVEVTGGDARGVTTSAEGTFSVDLAPGEYEVTVRRYGFTPGVRSVRVSDGGSSDLTFRLAVAPTVTAEGAVADDRGEPVASALVSLTAPGAEPVTTGTDGSGRWTLPGVPAGRYAVAVVPDGCRVPTQVLAEVGGEPVVTTVETKVDAAGYACVKGREDYRRGETPLAGLSDIGPVDDWTAPVELPFAFPFYGSRYGKAYVSSNGWLSFEKPVNSAGYPYHLPDAAAPHAALYPYWEDVWFQEPGGVFTAETTVDGKKAFVVEWREMTPSYNDAWRTSFSVTIVEDGTVVYGYGPRVENTDEKYWLSGYFAVIGMENETSTIHSQFSGYQAYQVYPGDSIRYTRGPVGTVTGTVTDANDGAAVPAARVELVPDQGGATAVGYAREDGTYAVTAPLGSYDVVVSAHRYETGGGRADLGSPGATVEVAAALATGLAGWDAAPVEWFLAPDGTASAEVTVTNTGSAPLRITPGTRALPDRPAADGEVPADPGHTHGDAAAAAGVSSSDGRTPEGRWTDDPAVAGAEPTAAIPPSDEVPPAPRAALRGAVGVERTVPTTPWTSPNGLGYDARTDSVWFTETGGKDVVLGLDGTTRASYAYAQAYGAYARDLEQDTTTGEMCQTFEQGSAEGISAVHCFDPATGAETRTYELDFDDHALWGLAYDREEDAFFVSSQQIGRIFRFAGTTHDEPGALLGWCDPALRSTLGMAYNTTSDTLWVTAAVAGGLQLSALDPVTCETERVLETGLRYPVGLATDVTGGLWVADATGNAVRLLDVGDPLLTPHAGVEVTSAVTEVAPGGSAVVTIAADAATLGTGVHHLEAAVVTSGAKSPVLGTPVHVVRSGYAVAVNAGGPALTGADGTVWRADTAWSDGGWGHTGTTKVTDLSGPAGGKPGPWSGKPGGKGPLDVTGTDDDALYLTQRTGDEFTYQFDDAPEGTYELAIDLAELDTKVDPGDRLYDVLVNGSITDATYEIDAAAAVGTRAAHVVTVTFEHPGGDLEVRFHGRPGHGYAPPSVAGLEVTHRPDL